MAITKIDYITRSLSKIKHKPWELYVISRIIHKLDDLDVEFKCQQLVRRREGVALVDMFFPQLGIYLEVDEPQHRTKTHQLSDKERKLEIFDATGLTECRIEVFETNKDGKPIDKDVGDLNYLVDLFIKKISERKLELQKTGKFLAWDIEQKYSPKPHIDRGYIDVNDTDVAFRYVRDALECFGYTGGHYEQGTWAIDKDRDLYIWFPKLFNQNDWKNKLSDDGMVIFEIYEKDIADGYRKAMKNKKNRIVFAHETDVLGKTLYKFKGVFVRDDTNSSPKKGVFYNRVKSCVKLPKADNLKF